MLKFTKPKQKDVECELLQAKINMLYNETKEMSIKYNDLRTKYKLLLNSFNKYKNDV